MSEDKSQKDLPQPQAVISQQEITDLKAEDASTGEGGPKAPVKCREMSISLPNNLRVAAKHWGSKTAPIKVIALHGWLDNASTWDGLAPLLAQNGFDIVAIDFIGHGKSQHLPPEAEPTFLNYIVQVVDVAQALGWSSFNLLAHSMGAAVATIVAGALPTLIESCILVESLGPLTSEVPAPNILEDGLRDRMKNLQRKPKIYPTVDDCIRKLRQNNPHLAEHSAKAIVKRGTITTSGGVSFCHDPRLVGNSLIRYREQDVLAYLKRIRCPVLSIWAKGTLESMRKQDLRRREKATDPSQPAQISEDESRRTRMPSIAESMEQRLLAISHVKVLIVDGYHHVHIDTPEAIVKQVLKFIARPKPKL